METKTAGYQSTETWSGSAVRWFVDHLGAGKDKLSEKVGASLDKVQAWPETFRQAGRPVVHKISRNKWMEQAEFWPDSTDEAKAEPAAVAEQKAEAPVETVPFVKVASLREPKLVEAKATRRVAARRNISSSRAAVSRPAKVRVNGIARFLNVNGAIEGMKTEGIRFDLPGRGFSQALRLWSGSNEVEPYTIARF